MREGSLPVALILKFNLHWNLYFLSWTWVSNPMTASYSINLGNFYHGCTRMHTDFSID